MAQPQCCSSACWRGGTALASGRDLDRVELRTPDSVAGSALGPGSQRLQPSPRKRGWLSTACLGLRLRSHSGTSRASSIPRARFLASRAPSDHQRSLIPPPGQGLSPVPAGKGEHRWEGGWRGHSSPRMVYRFSCVHQTPPACLGSCPAPGSGVSASYSPGSASGAGGQGVPPGAAGTRTGLAGPVMQGEDPARCQTDKGRG